MAKKRTKQDKIRARHQLMQHQSQTQAEVPNQSTAETQSQHLVPPSKVVSQSKTDHYVRIFGFEPHLIWRDLQKTMVVFAVVGILLVVASWFVNR